MNMIRCALLSTVLSTLPAGIARPTARADEMSVTLLGTGTPTPGICRFSASTLVEAGQQKLCSTSGAARRHDCFGVTTDMLSDDIVGFADMWLSDALILRARKNYDGPPVIG
jgi:hypothetical protein